MIFKRMRVTGFGAISQGPAAEGVNLQPGWNVVVGKNGAGKSTLIASHRAAASNRWPGGISSQSGFLSRLLLDEGEVELVAEVNGEDIHFLRTVSKTGNSYNHSRLFNGKSGLSDKDFMRLAEEAFGSYEVALATYYLSQTVDGDLIAMTEEERRKFFIGILKDLENVVEKGRNWKEKANYAKGCLDGLLAQAGELDPERLKTSLDEARKRHGDISDVLKDFSNKMNAHRQEWDNAKGALTRLDSELGSTRESLNKSMERGKSFAAEKDKTQREKDGLEDALKDEEERLRKKMEAADSLEKNIKEREEKIRRLKEVDREIDSCIIAHREFCSARNRIGALVMRLDVLSINIPPLVDEKAVRWFLEDDSVQFKTKDCPEVAQKKMDSARENCHTKKATFDKAESEHQTLNKTILGMKETMKSLRAMLRPDDEKPNPKIGTPEETCFACPLFSAESKRRDDEVRESIRKMEDEIVEHEKKCMVLEGRKIALNEELLKSIEDEREARRAYEESLVHVLQEHLRGVLEGYWGLDDNEFLDQLREELAALKDAIAALDKAIEGDPEVAFESHQASIVERRESIAVLTSKLEGIEKSIEETRKEFAEIRDKMRSLEARHGDSTARTRALMDTFKAMEEEYKSLVDEDVELRAEIRSLEEALNKARALDHRINLARRNLDAHNLLAKAWKELRSILIQSEMDRFSEIATSIVQTIMGEGVISVDTNPDLKDGRARDGFIISYDNGREPARDVSGWSGGQRQALSLTLRLAIARFMGTSMETLIVDEGFNNMDSSLVEITVDMMNMLLREGGLRQIIVVTHNPAELSLIPANNIVTLEK